MAKGEAIGWSDNLGGLGGMWRDEDAYIYANYIYVSDPDFSCGRKTRVFLLADLEIQEKV